MSAPEKAVLAADRLVVGWREFVGLPEWGIRALRAKIDTGARTSALHVDDIRHLPGGKVSFDVVLGRSENPRKVHVVAAERVRIARVRPSSGVEQHRHVVATTLRLGPVERTIEISLVDRGPMLCRMLVGRAALGDDVLVDPQRAYLLGRKRTRRRSR